MGAMLSKTARFNINDERPERSTWYVTDGTFSAMGGEHEVYQNQALEDEVIQAQCSVLSAAKDGLKEIRMTTDKQKQDLEDVTIESMHSITSATVDCINEIGETVGTGINEIQNAKENELKSFRSHCEAEKKAHRETCSHMKQEDYVRDRDGMIREIKKHYVDTLSYIRTSPLNNNADKSMLNIYVPPYIQLLKKFKGTFHKTGTQVTKYKDLFLTFAKENQRTYIQGEAGTGKTTFAAKLALDWSGMSTNATTEQSKENVGVILNSRMRNTILFDDVTTIQKFKFVFHVTLRNSINQVDVTQMVKEQIINSIFPKEDQEHAYALLNEIMKSESCLVVLDGLDEWNGPENNSGIPSLITCHNRCVLLITSRPWKLAETEIPFSTIDTILQLEGLSDPFALSKKIMDCRENCQTNQDMEAKQSAFKLYIETHGLQKLLSSSPMLLDPILCSWEEEKHLKGSMCELYIILLECLIKKANSKRQRFNESRFPCFSETQYIQPNVEYINRLSHLAFKLLFSSEREQSMVFAINTLRHINLESEVKEFALKAGILSETSQLASIRSVASFSFIHKSVQEFLAAIHIVNNSEIVDEVIYWYLYSHGNAYLDISNVFIFICGLDVSVANKLSNVMNMVDIARGKSHTEFEEIIMKGYLEAVSNNQTGINLKLSHYNINADNIVDSHALWKMNKDSVQSLVIDIPICNHKTSASDKSATSIEFDLSTCHKLETLHFGGDCIRITDLSSSDPSVILIRLPMKNILSTQMSDPLRDRIAIRNIKLTNVRCTSTLLRSLFTTLLTLDHPVVCKIDRCVIEACDIDSSKSEAVRTYISTECQHSLKIYYIEVDSPGLWESLHGLSMTNLSLSGRWRGLNITCLSSFSKTLVSLTNLESLQIQLDITFDPPDLWKGLNRQNIKSLNLCLNSSLRQNDDKDLKNHHASLMVQTLASLSQLENLSIQLNIDDDMSGLWDVLRNLNIKHLSLRLSGGLRGFKINLRSSLSEVLSSLTKLETISVHLYSDADCKGLWEALQNLKIKSLYLSHSGGWRGLLVTHVSTLSESLSTLGELETLRLYLHRFIDIQLPRSLKYLVFVCDGLSTSQLFFLVKKLSTYDHAVECKLNCGCIADDTNVENSKLPMEEILEKIKSMDKVEIEQFHVHYLQRRSKKDNHYRFSVRKIIQKYDETENDSLTFDEWNLDRFVRRINEDGHKCVVMHLRFNG